MGCCSMKISFKSYILPNHTKFTFHFTIYHACYTYKIYAFHNIKKTFYHWVKLALLEDILSSDNISKTTSSSLPEYHYVLLFERQIKKQKKKFW